MNLETLIPYLPLYFAIVPLVIYIVGHEKKHSRIVLYLKMICEKLGIPCDEKD